MWEGFGGMTGGGQRRGRGRAGKFRRQNWRERGLSRRNWQGEAHERGIG